MALTPPPKFDHDRLIAHMTGPEVLAEYVHLNSGKAGVKERRGVDMGLTSEHESRRQLLKTHIERCIQECHTVAA